MFNDVKVFSVDDRVQNDVDVGDDQQNQADALRSFMGRRKERLERRENLYWKPANDAADSDQHNSFDDVSLSRRHIY